MIPPKTNVSKKVASRLFLQPVLPTLLVAVTVFLFATIHFAVTVGAVAAMEPGSPLFLFSLPLAAFGRLDVVVHGDYHAVVPVLFVFRFTHPSIYLGEQTAYLIHHRRHHPSHQRCVSGSKHGPAPRPCFVLDGNNGGQTGEVEEGEDHVA